MQNWTPPEAPQVEVAPPEDAWAAWLHRARPAHVEADMAVRPGLGVIVGLGLSGFWLGLGALAWWAMT